MKKQLILILITAAVSVSLTRFYWPKVEMRVEEKEVVKKDIRTVIKEVVKKDGTKETVTEIIDNSREQRQATKEIFAQSDWLVSASYGMKEFKGEPIYGAQVQRRVFGPIFVGLAGSTDKVYSVSVGMEF